MSGEAEIEKARRILNGAKSLAVFTGAGVSADSGVPTFRGSSQDALWGKYDPQVLASAWGFQKDPKLVYEWYSWRRSQLARVEPNAAHLAIARLQERSGAVVMTQNVDGLHERVAPAGARVLRVHGTILEDRCMRCAHWEKVDLNSPPNLRMCLECGAGYLRPGVVWFGESLPEDVWEESQQAARECDAMLVVGTSGQVQPAASLVERAAGARAKIVVVNLEGGLLDEYATAALHGRAAEVVPRIVD